MTMMAEQHLQPVRLDKALLNNSATDGGLRRNGHVATGVGTAPPPFPATDNGAVVTAPVASSLISQSLY